MSDTVDVAIVGAGPYGLSLAAHLRAAGVSFRQFGLPMQLWRAAMPAGIFLKSQGFASNLSSPDGEHTLEAFCTATGRRYASYGVPVPLDTFVAYGLWFQQELVPEVEHTLVTDVAEWSAGYQLALANGDTATARTVVVAVGVEHFAVVPDQLAALPSWACTHSSAHTDLAEFSGRSVIVMGAGQSALESAALLHESGADVRLVARKPSLAWNGRPLPPDRSFLARLREPEAGLGSGWSTWFYSRHPDLFRHLPKGSRVYRARTALGPAGACWLPPRVLDQFPVMLGQTLSLVKADGSAVLLGIEGADGVRRELKADHVIAATGYRADMARLTFLSDQLRRRVKTLAGTPAVGASYESSVAGLYFIGPAVAPTFGPVMRFVYGSDHAARVVARRLAGAARSSPRSAARAAL
jgi:Pyridine nucleotide-disulphide oxidoreductase